MDKNEFKDLIFHLVSNYSSNQTFINYEKDISNKIVEYDPELSKLLNEHINCVEKIYSYILVRAESNKDK